MQDYKQQTIHSYEKHTDFYAQKFKALLDLKRRTEFSRFLELIPGSRILDVGCGAGDHALYFAAQGLDVSCVDISPRMVKLCKQKGLKAQVMDIEDLRFEDNSFDGIWAVTSLLHIPKAKMPSVVQKLYDIIKEKGMLYVSVREGDGEKLVSDKQDPATKRFFAFWRPSELLKLFEDKFDVIQWKRTKVNTHVFLEVFFRKK